MTHRAEAASARTSFAAPQTARRAALLGVARAATLPAAMTVLSMPLAACAGRSATSGPRDAGRPQVTRLSTEWTYLIDDGRGLEKFRRYGTADWALVDGTLQAQRGGREPSYLVTPESYDDVELMTEFWVSPDANSGVFLRCQVPDAVSDKSAYEANIFDQRPDPTYGTGSIVNVASVQEPRPTAGGRWNTMEFRAKGSRLTVRLNGRQTADAEDLRFVQGPIALQWGGGTVRFRRVMLRRPV